MAERWKAILDELPIRPARPDEVEFTCQARELTRLTGDHGKYRVLALVEWPDLPGTGEVQGTTHLLTVATRRSPT